MKRNVNTLLQILTMSCKLKSHSGVINGKWGSLCHLINTTHVTFEASHRYMHFGSYSISCIVVERFFLWNIENASYWNNILNTESKQHQHMQINFRYLMGFYDDIFHTLLGRQRKRCWSKRWILWQPTLGFSATLVEELAIEDA